MKAGLSLLLSFFFFQFNAQILFEEDFENELFPFELNTSEFGAVVDDQGANRWIVNAAYQGGGGNIECMGFPFSFTVPDTPTQPAGITASPESSYLHIVNNASDALGISCSSFAAADGVCTEDESNFCEMTSDISTLGYSDIDFSFWWMCGGGETVWGEVYYSTDMGSTWVQVGGNFNNQATWTQVVLSDAGFADQAQLRFAFRFVNQASFSATEPSFCIDDIRVESSCTPIELIIDAVSCEDTYTDSNGQVYDVPGVYSETYTSSGGCDSTVTLGIEYVGVDASYSQVGETLTANVSGLEYQWLLCELNLEPIPGATQQSYAPEESGLYAVQVSNFFCEATSDCLPFTVSNLDAHFLGKISIYPNPSSEYINIALGETELDRIEVLDEKGARVFTLERIKFRKNIIPVQHLSEGVYRIQFFNKDRLVGTRAFKKDN